MQNGMKLKTQELTERIRSDISKNVQAYIPAQVDICMGAFVPGFIAGVSEKLSSRLQKLDGSAWATWRDEQALAEKMIAEEVARELIKQIQLKYKIKF